MQSLAHLSLRRLLNWPPAFYLSLMLLAFPMFRSAGQKDLVVSDARAQFAGSWQQNNDRCVPSPRSKAVSNKMTVTLNNPTLRVHIVSNNGRGERQLDLTYEIDGKEIVYTGMDGDEYHSKVRWAANSLVFTNVEHERGRIVPSQEIWTLLDSGKSLQRVRVTTDSAEDAKHTCILDRTL